jgi:hypothetical protein
MIVFLVSTFAFAFDARILNYSVNFQFDSTGFCDVFESIVVDFARPLHGIERRIRDEGVGWPFLEFPITDISVDGHPWDTVWEQSFLTIRIGSHRTMVEGVVVYPIHYRIPPPAVISDVIELSLSVIGTAWTFPIDDSHFRIQFPKPIKTSQVLVYSGGQDAITNSANCHVTATGQIIEGSCPPLSTYTGLNITIPIDRFYFSGTSAEMALLPIALILIVLVYLLIFRYSDSASTAETHSFVDLLPLELSELCIGKSNIRSEILYLAGKGHITLALDSCEQPTLTAVEVVDSNPIDHAITQALFEAFQTKNEPLTSSEINIALIPIYRSLRAITLTSLYQKGMLRTASPCCNVLSWIWIIFAHLFFALIEFSFVSKSFIQPSFYGIILFFLPVLLVGPCSFDVSVALSSRLPRWRWYVFPWMLVHVGIAFGIYWMVPCGWDHIVMCAWAALAAELQVWVMIAQGNWTLRGAKGAIEGLLYVKKLSQIEPGVVLAHRVHRYIDTRGKNV